MRSTRPRSQLKPTDVDRSTKKQDLGMQSSAPQSGKYGRQRIPAGVPAIQSHWPLIIRRRCLVSPGVVSKVPTVSRSDAGDGWYRRRATQRERPHLSRLAADSASQCSCSFPCSSSFAAISCATLAIVAAAGGGVALTLWSDLFFSSSSKIHNGAGGRGQQGEGIRRQGMGWARCACRVCHGHRRFRVRFPSWGRRRTASRAVPVAFAPLSRLCRRGPTHS